MFRLSALCLFGLLWLESGAQVFSAGLIGGASTSQVGGDRLSGFDKFGGSAGAFTKATLSNKFILEFDVLYINKGSKKNADFDNGDYDVYKMQVNYLEMPILLKYELTDYGVKMGAGVYVGKLLNATEFFNGADYEPSVPFSELDTGFMLAAEYGLGDHLFAELRFSQSLNTIRPVPQGTPFTYYDGRQYHSVLQLMLGYAF